MRALLVLVTDNVNLDQGVDHAGLFLSLGLVDDLLGHKDLLDDLPGGRNIVVQQNAGGHTPTHDEHHDSHDNHHHLGALHLSARLVAGHVHLGNEGQDAEQNQRDEVRQRGAETVGEGLGRRSDEVRQDVEEGEALLSRIREIMTKVAQRLNSATRMGI